MSTNYLVYPHPINVFVFKFVGTTVEQFCDSYGYSQSTVATWVTRERKVELLPSHFVNALSLASSKSMDEVYVILLDLQEEYMNHIEENKRTKKELEELPVYHFLPHAIKQKVRKLNRLQQESYEVLEQIESELEKYDMDIELFTMGVSDVPVEFQSEDISNILNGQVKKEEIEEVLMSMEKIFNIHAKSNS